VRAPEQAKPVAPEPPARPRPETQARAQGGQTLSHRVQWGDTLWRITERYYGDASLYDLLASENALADPDLLISGTELRLPPRIDDQDRRQ
jgi:nucleoid-associated protein YgaU